MRREDRVLAQGLGEQMSDWVLEQAGRGAHRVSTRSAKPSLYTYVNVSLAEPIGERDGIPSQHWHPILSGLVIAPREIWRISGVLRGSRAQRTRSEAGFLGVLTAPWMGSGKRPGRGFAAGRRWEAHLELRHAMDGSD